MKKTEHECHIFITSNSKVERNQTSKRIIEQLDYKAEDITITDMWANVLKDTEHHPMHTHSNNFLSGTYYLQSDQKAAYLNQVVKYLEQVLRSINNRTFLIKNAIEWKKFTSGAI